MNWRILLLLSILPVTGFSQQRVLLKGQATDSLHEPVAFATVVADGQGFNDVQYTFTSDSGRFALRLLPDSSYILSIQMQGMRTWSKHLRIHADTVIRIRMRLESENLKPVTITYTPPVRRKGDTTTFDKASFASGNEYKLRDVLEKIPGVEVDNRGNVKYQGRRVKKLLVENKDFFWGDPKLGTNYIPANAVDKIQIIDNYQSVSMMRGFADTDDLAMNIKLKKNKKHFVFGDMEAGFGAPDRFALHPVLFYYSPGFYGNGIADVNNAGQKFFTFRDFMKMTYTRTSYFESNYSRLLAQNKEISRILNDRSPYDDRYKLYGIQAGNASRKINVSVSHFTFVDNRRTADQSRTVRKDLGFTETTHNRSYESSVYNVEKFGLRYAPYLTRYFKTDWLYTWLWGGLEQNSELETSGINQNTGIEKKLHTTHLNGQTEAYLRSGRHIYSVYAEWDERRESPSALYRLENPLFPGLPQTQAQLPVSVNEARKIHSQHGQVSFKTYYRINRRHLAGVETGLVYEKQSLNIAYTQRLHDGIILNFPDSLFTSVNSAQRMVYGNMFYKFMKNHWTVSLTVGVENYKAHWTSDMQSRYGKQTFFKPKISLRRKKGATRLQLTYSRLTDYPDAYQLSPNYRIVRQYYLERGQVILRPGFHDELKGFWNYFDLRTGWTGSAMINGLIERMAFRTNTYFESQFPASESLLIDSNDYQWFGTGSIGRMNAPWYWSVGIEFSNGRTSYYTEGNINTTTEKSLGANLSLRTLRYRKSGFGIRYGLRQTILFPEEQKPVTNLVHRLRFNVYLPFGNRLIFRYTFNSEIFHRLNGHRVSYTPFHRAELQFIQTKSPWRVRILADNISGAGFLESQAETAQTYRYYKRRLFPPVLMVMISYRI